MLQEADDPDAKLMLPGNISPSIHRLTIDSEEDTTGDGDQEATVLIAQDPPPSYIDVQAFRERVGTEEEVERAHRVRRRFGLALGIAVLLVSLSIIIGILIGLSPSLQNEIVNVSLSSILPFRSTDSIHRSLSQLLRPLHSNHQIIFHGGLDPNLEESGVLEVPHRGALTTAMSMGQHHGSRTKVRNGQAKIAGLSTLHSMIQRGQ
jgi:hypothetical protein